MEAALDRAVLVVVSGLVSGAGASVVVVATAVSAAESVENGTVRKTETEDCDKL